MGQYDRAGAVASDHDAVRHAHEHLAELSGHDWDGERQRAFRLAGEVMQESHETQGARTLVSGSGKASGLSRGGSWSAARGILETAC